MNIVNKRKFFDEGALAFQIDFDEPDADSSVIACRSKVSFSAPIYRVAIAEDCIAVNFFPFANKAQLPPMPTVMAFSFNGYIKWLPPVFGSPRIGSVYATRSYAGCYTSLTLNTDGTLWMRDISGWELSVNASDGSTVKAELVSP